MSSPQKNYELTKLRILQFLSEPEAEQFGATDGAIGGRVLPERLVNFRRLLPEMHATGLIDRRQDSTNKSAKPYFITQAGKDYLANTPDRATFDADLHKRSWAVRISGTRLDNVVNEVIRRLPEFRNSSDDRIDEAATEVTNAIAQAVGMENIPSPSPFGRS